MGTIKIKSNSLGLDIQVNGIPNVKLIPQDQLKVFASALESCINTSFTRKLKERTKKKDR